MKLTKSNSSNIAGAEHLNLMSNMPILGRPSAQLVYFRMAAELALVPPGAAFSRWAFSGGRFSRPANAMNSRAASNRRSRQPFRTESAGQGTDLISSATQHATTFRTRTQEVHITRTLHACYASNHAADAIQDGWMLKLHKSSKACSARG